MTLMVGSVSPNEANLRANDLGIQVAYLPTKYLGLPLCSSRINMKKCLPHFEKIMDTIKFWQSRFLSYAGRLELIKSVVSAFCTYWLCSFVLPKTILYRVKAPCNKFLWEGLKMERKLYLTSIDKLCKSKCVGGLGITDPVVGIWDPTAALFSNYSLPMAPFWPRK